MFLTRVLRRVAALRREVDMSSSDYRERQVSRDRTAPESRPFGLRTRARGRGRCIGVGHEDPPEIAGASLSDASRSSRRRTFPIGVFGKMSRISTWRGTLYPVSSD